MSQNDTMMVLNQFHNDSHSKDTEPSPGGSEDWQAARMDSSSAAPASTIDFGGCAFHVERMVQSVPFLRRSLNNEG
jgi:hypothetical protein